MAHADIPWSDFSDDKKFPPGKLRQLVGDQLRAGDTVTVVDIPAGHPMPMKDAPTFEKWYDSF